MKTPRFWQSDGVLPHALAPLATAYGFGAALDRRRTRTATAPLPVIGVGNATVGGAGKTPVTLALARLLQQHGATPHAITRGYKGTVRGCHRVTAEDDWRRVGDEALLLAAAAPTWVAPRRIDGAMAAAGAGATHALLDDALQHHALKKDLSLLVVDGAYGIGNGRVFPAGPLREPWAEALKRSDAVVLIGDDRQGLTATLPHPVLRARLSIAGGAALGETPWLAFAGIGRPEKFYATLRAAGARVVATRDFPDHHAYRTADFDRLLRDAGRLNARLITTAKDAVKIPAAHRPEIEILHVSLSYDHADSLADLLVSRGLMQRT